MLFTYVTLSLLAIGLMRSSVQIFVTRISSIGIICTLPLVAQLPESSMSIFTGIMSYGSLANTACFMLSVLGTGLLLYSNYDYAKDSYSVFGICSIIGSMLIISSNDLITLFLGIELQSFSVYLIAASNRSSLSSTGAALKYFFLGALSTALILFGATTQYGFAGSTSIEGVDFNVWSLAFIMAGMYFKVAASPFHAWAPDVYDGVNTEVSAWLQVMPKVALILFRITVNITASYYIGILSIMIGSIYGLSQTRVRRLLAYSTVSHVGFLLLSSNENTLLYLISYSITTMCALFTLHILNDRGELKDLSGIGNEMPALSISFAVLLFSLAGIPPLFGFFAKARVLQDLIANDSLAITAIAILAILASVVSAYYYLSLISLMFFSSKVVTVSGENSIASGQGYLVSVFTSAICFYVFAHPITINFCKVMVFLNTIYAFVIIVPILIAVLFLLNWILSRSHANPEKASAYECGFDALQQTRNPFNIRYYLVAVRFLLLDLEVALLFPVVVTLFQEGASLYGFFVVLIFLALLTIGFAYEFGKGALHIASQRASINRAPIKI